LRNCDLEGLNLKFKEGAVVNLDGATKLPKDLDFSQCSSVDLRDCDLRGLNLKFRKGAEVNLIWAENLPEVLDFSMCSDVSLRNLSGVKEIKFKDKKQEEKFMGGAKNFEGKVVYASIFSRIRKRFDYGGMGE
jgi:hypothetical protein